MVMMLPKVAGVTEKRAGTISGDLDTADKARLEAEDRREAYEASLASTRAEAQDVIAGAKSDAAKANEARMAEADAAAQTRLAQAEAELDKARRDALVKLDAIAAEATQDIVEKLTGTRPADAKAAAAVAAAQG
jgi:F-type H+-transporting ATPase subunit b